MEFNYTGLPQCKSFQELLGWKGGGYTWCIRKSGIDSQFLELCSSVEIESYA